MRKLLFLIAFICIHAVSFSQYQSIFGDNATAWNIKHEQLFGTYYDSSVTVVDTIVGGLTYKKVNFYVAYNNVPTLQYFYLIREDTLTGKAWCRDIGGPETLWYDISLQMGDNFNGLVVDSVYYTDNKRYVRFNTFIEGTTKKLFIEGVGANDGIPCATGLNPVLLCQHKDDTAHFVNSTGIYTGLCSIVTTPNGVTGKKDNGHIQIFTSSSQEIQVYVTLDRNRNMYIQITDIHGRIVYSSGNREMQSGLNELSFPFTPVSGIYIIEVRDCSAGPLERLKFFVP